MNKFDPKTDDRDECLIEESPFCRDTSSQKSKISDGNHISIDDNSDNEGNSQTSDDFPFSLGENKDRSNTVTTHSHTTQAQSQAKQTSVNRSQALIKSASKASFQLEEPLPLVSQKRVVEDQDTLQRLQKFIKHVES